MSQLNSATPLNELLCRLSMGMNILFLLGIATLFFSSCTVKRPPVLLGAVPEMQTVSIQDQEYGEKLFHRLSKKHALNTEAQRYHRANVIFQHLLITADVGLLPWQLHIFDTPDIADVRAVHGNRVFIWSGLLDLAQNDSEIAGLLACEIAHVLARHTEPVDFNVVSDILFEVASVAASVGILAASQGTVAIGGQGWLKELYVNASDLDSLDRKYDLQLEKEAATIALVILARSRYSPEGVLAFWKRVDKEKDLAHKTNQLARGIPSQKRVAMLSDLMPRLATWVPREQRSTVLTLSAPITFRNP